jgi:hypothetical protein
MISRQPVTRRGRQQGGLPRNPGAEGLGLLNDPFFRSDLLLSLGSGQIYGRLWRGAGRSTCNRLLALGLLELVLPSASVSEAWTRAPSIMAISKSRKPRRQVGEDDDDRNGASRVSVNVGKSQTKRTSM